MKTHLRIIDLTPKARTQFRVACGCSVAQWTRDTTSDVPKVTCRRCLQSAANLIDRGRAKMTPVWKMRKDKTREIVREELTILPANSQLTQQPPV
jgi:hypothetical protein